MTISSSHSNFPQNRAPRGFAIIASISILSLVLMLALAMVSLSKTTTAEAVNRDAISKAKANARLALGIAISQLQQHTGVDTRITASASLIDPSNPPLHGVWESWQGSNHDSNTGRPNDKGNAPDYANNKSSRFRAWLVSSAGKGSGIGEAKNLVFTAPTTDTIPLLAAGTLGEKDERQVHVVPSAVEKGSTAWWVIGENQKARLAKPYEPDVDNAAGWAALAKSHGVADPKAYGLDPANDADSLFNQPQQVSKALTLRMANLIPAAEGVADTPTYDFHDLSVSSVGLPINVATGGWRKDLSLMTEKWDQLPQKDLPFFRISDKKTSMVERPTLANPVSQQSLLYPWSDYGKANVSSAVNQHGPTSSWAHLIDYTLSYKRIKPDGNNFSIDHTWSDVLGTSNTDIYNYLHRSTTTPLVARIHWVFSHQTINVSDPNDNKPDFFRLNLIVTPLITIWNPLNVSIACDNDMFLRFGFPPPCVLRYHYQDSEEKKKLSAYRKFYRGTTIYGNPTGAPNYGSIWDMNHADFKIAKLDLALAPGETRVLSPNRTINPGVGTHTLDMKPGYRPNTGFKANVSNKFKTGTYREDEIIKVDFKFNNAIKASPNNPAPKVGLWFEVFSEKVIGGARMMLYYVFAPLDKANEYWPPINSDDIASFQAAACEDEPRPFFSYTFGSRISNESGFPGKGVTQSSPILNSAQIGRGGNWHEGLRLKGHHHPVNAAYDYGFIPHTSAGDAYIPNVGKDNRGYIITGTQSGNGLSKVIFKDLPLRPITSIVELQNWNLRGSNRYPPYQTNILGNSDASPLFAPKSMFQNGLQQDDSYCANHVLFDDWFVSSIAPDPEGFGAGGRDIETVYKDFLKGTHPLPNRSYRPIAQDRNIRDDSLDLHVSYVLNYPDSWQKIASRLEVEGMFNVNSVSLPAWKAMLGHCRGHRIPYFTENGIALSDKKDHAISRFAVAGDILAGKKGAAGEFADASEVSGYRVFTDEMIDILAEKVVEQVRLRGPFLSLSEFVNRQLSSGDLALAGALQTALNQLPAALKNPDDDPFLVLKELSDDTGFIGPIPPEAGYAFPKASIGKTHYGLPGWIRQADILRPLAPMLSVRDDTFTIRAYGDARDNDGNVLSRAWCEATVQRTRDYMDAVDPADSINPPSSEVNLNYGRKYKVVSFRWLTQNEV